MAFTKNAIGRVRPSGDDTNGAFFDPSLTTNMLTDLAATSGNTSAPVVTSASYTFVAGDVGAYVFVASGTNWIPGWYLIASVNAGAATLTASAGSVRCWTPTSTNPTTPALQFNTVAGCASAASPTGGTFSVDYTQQNAAELSLTDVASSNTTTFTSATGGFTKAMIGNAIRCTGGGATSGYYFIVNQTDTNTITTDRAGGTIAAGTGKVGGGAATIRRVANSANATGDEAVAGNTVYIYGSGVDLPTSDDYTATDAQFTPPSGTAADGYFRMIGENGRPRLKNTGLMFHNAALTYFDNLYLTASSNANGTLAILNLNGTGCVVKNLIINTANQAALVGIQGTSANAIENCEVLSGTTSPTSSASAIGIHLSSAFASYVRRCRVHHQRSHGIQYSSTYGAAIDECLVYANVGDGLNLTTSGSGKIHASHNTIDGNQGHGIAVTTFVTAMNTTLRYNLITNHTQASKYGITISTGSALVNDPHITSIGYNWLYNNTANYQNLTQPPTDTVGTDPQYTDAANGDFSVGTNAKGAIQETWLGQSTPTSYREPGAVQRQEAGGSNSMKFPIGMTGGIVG